MTQAATEPKRIGVRDFQHNLARHIESVRHGPIVVTKFGKDQFVIADAGAYELKKKKVNQTYLTPNLKFFGMYKTRKDWKGKSSARIARELRKAAWYGK